jgi:hypothetical protein
VHLISFLLSKRNVCWLIGCLACLERLPGTVEQLERTGI